MKSEHRHELKTNELAEWLGNLPQWTKENLTTILVILAVVVVGVTFLIWRSYNKNVVLVREHLEFSNLLNQLSAIEGQIPSAQAQGRDLSFTLIPAADGLGSFAQNASNGRMAALALIKQAEALRTELHYRPGLISKQDLTNRINQAKTAYTEAIQRSSDNSTLKAAAEFGLGLCEEELGNFEEAQKIYQGIAANDDFEGTVAKAAAKHRLEIMTDYRQKVVFKPAPAPAASSQPTIEINPLDTNLSTASQPTIQLRPVEVNLPAETTLPVDVNQESQAPEIVPEVNSKVPEPNVSGK
jgi:tetratricopeptide (TPR) repeat protein